MYIFYLWKGSLHLVSVSVFRSEFILSESCDFLIFLTFGDSAGCVRVFKNGIVKHWFWHLFVYHVITQYALFLSINVRKQSSGTVIDEYHIRHYQLCVINKLFPSPSQVLIQRNVLTKELNFCMHCLS